MIIGLTGTIGSGKGIVAEVLKQLGFRYYSLSDEVREEARRRKIPLTRENLQKLGNELRAEFGNAVLARWVIKRIIETDGDDIVIDGIRNLAEVAELRNYFQRFVLVGIDAPPRIRFARILRRARENDPKTYKEFLRVDAIDRGLANKADNSQQVSKCLRAADCVILNTGSLEELRLKINRMLRDIKKVDVSKRPSWDEYFMKLAYLARERATCLRRKVGAVLVKDKQVISTGYNGPPRGLKHCEVCLRTKLGVPPGERTELSRAVHAEANTLIQCAVHGKSSWGSTLYVTHYPCSTCAKMLINGGIQEVVYAEDYEDELAKRFFEEAGIIVRRLKIRKNGL